MPACCSAEVPENAAAERLQLLDVLCVVLFASVHGVCGRECSEPFIVGPCYPQPSPIVCCGPCEQTCMASCSGNQLNAVPQQVVPARSPGVCWRACGSLS
jgi:hypothetical protein